MPRRPPANPSIAAEMRTTRHGPGGLVVAGPPSGPSDAFLSLLAIDFQGVYQVYIAAITERLNMLRFALSLLAAPYAATVALVSARVVPPGSLTSWRHVPAYVFGLLVAFGLLAVPPYLRMIEAHISHARTARAMNNFRLLYTQELREQFRAVRWSPNLPVDPHYPDQFELVSWPGITVTVLALLEAASVTIGLVGLARVAPSPVLIGTLIATFTLLLFALYYIRTNISRRRKQPDNPFGFPSVET